MSLEHFNEIKETLERMLRIEYDSSISEMRDMYFFIDSVNDKLIIKNYDSDYEFIDDIQAYFIVNDYEYLQYFQIGYTFNEFELIEFDLEIDDW